MSFSPWTSNLAHRKTLSLSPALRRLLRFMPTSLDNGQRAPRRLLTDVVRRLVAALKRLTRAGYHRAVAARGEPTTASTTATSSPRPLISS